MAGPAVKMNTGVGVLDNTYNAGVDVMVGINNTGKNIERRGADLYKNTAAVLSGKSKNNIANTVLEGTVAVATGGASLAADYKAGDSPIDRATEDQATADMKQAEADKAAEVQATQEKFANVLEAKVKQRRKSPGSQITLLGGGSGSGSLLTPKGG